MNAECEKDYEIHFGLIDNRGVARPSALFDVMQDAATIHAYQLGLSPDTIDAVWVLSRLHCRVVRPLRPYETVHVRTWGLGVKGVSWLRAFSLSVGGDMLGEALSSWITLNPETRRIVRPGQVDAARDYIALAAGLNAPPPPGKLSCPALTPHHVHTVRYADLDVNGHMNNVKIVDVVCDGLELERRAGQFVSDLQVNYTAECMPGEQIALAVGDDPQGRIHVAGSVGAQAKFEAAALFSPFEA